MKKKITPIGIITVFVMFILAQSSVSYSNNSALMTIHERQDTTPDKKNKKDKKKKDKDTSNWPKPDTMQQAKAFSSAYRP